MPARLPTGSTHPASVGTRWPANCGANHESASSCFTSGEREGADQPRGTVGVDLLDVGRAGQGGVVQDHQRAVDGPLDVVLDHVGALRKGQIDRGNGVLGCRSRGAAVGHHVHLRRWRRRGGGRDSDAQWDGEDGGDDDAACARDQVHETSRDQPARRSGRRLHAVGPEPARGVRRDNGP